MKKLMLILMVLGMAAPLYAAGRIQFSVTDNGNGSCTIVYDANSTFDIAPVAMGLTVKVTGGNPIKSVALEDETDFMEIYMDAAYSMEDPCGDPCTSYAYGTGTPIADPCGPGEVDLVTHGNHFVLSFGGLGGELAKTKAPPMSGTITLYADTQEAPAVAGDTVTGTIKLDARRGGVIGEDGEPMETNLDDPAKAGPMGFTISECFRSDHINQVDVSPQFGNPDHPQWVVAGKPVCWCLQYQCRGDTDGLYEGKPATAKYVVLDDLKTLGSAWQLAITDQAYIDNQAQSVETNFACADFDHYYEGKPAGAKRVTLPDLQVLGAGWQLIVTDVHFTGTPCFP